MHVCAWCVDFLSFLNNSVFTVNYYQQAVSIFLSSVTQHHAAVQQSWCLCSSSTPCAIKQMTLATSATTALCSQRLAVLCLWERYSSVGQGTWDLVTLLSLTPLNLPSLSLGSCCTCPVCCLGRGGLCEGVWSAQPAQDWLWPGGPPHTSKSRMRRSFLVLRFPWRTEYDVKVTFCI